MTMQSPRPARLAGLVLIGVAVVAVGLGIFTLTSNGSPQSQGRPPATGSTTTTNGTGPTTTPARSSSRPTTTTPGTSTTTPTFPSGRTTTVAPPPPPGGGQQGQPVSNTQMVRVYNNSMIKDLASQAAADFRAAGFNVVQVGNYPGGVIPTTTAYFTPGSASEQQTAEELGKDFNMQVQPRFQGIAFASPGVIVIVTEDFKGGGK